MRNLLAPLAAAALAATLSAQVCADNVYAIHLVNALGVPAPELNGIPQFTNDGVYLAFPVNIPSGVYYVHVTTRLNGDGTDAVLSLNDPTDRFVQVTNNAGVISLSLPFSDNVPPPVFGLGIGGVGQSILVAPFAADPDNTCEWKVWYGDCWDLSLGADWYGIVLGGFNQQTQSCCIRSYQYFNIGGPGSGDICGTVCFDANGNGQTDPGESGIGGIKVDLTGPGGPLSTTSAADGTYCFLGVGGGNYTISLDLTGTPYFSTTPSSFAVVVGACGNGQVPEFCVNTPSVPHDGHTPGFWRNNNGNALVTQYNILPTLPALCLANAAGQYVAPATLSAWNTFLKNANATNMAYMLSAHVAAMHCNVAVGFVDGTAVVNAGGSLGNITVSALLQQAVAALCADPYTPVGDPNRTLQEALKTALDDANNDLNWL